MNDEGDGSAPLSRNAGSAGEAPAVVREEQALLDRVTDTLHEVPPPKMASEEPIVRELERVRDALVSGTAQSDEVALTDQWHRQKALLRQVRRAKEAPEVDLASPYFAHLRLGENGVERDLCLGRATYIQRGVRIVDWRNAPVSRVFYRYEQGEDYEEVFAGRPRAGRVIARRTVSIRDGVLDRIEAPEGIFVAETGESGGWIQTHRERPRLAGGESAALRAHAVDSDAFSRRLGGDPEAGLHRIDKRLPEITGLIDPDQFELISRPSAGFLAIRGTAGSGKTTVALHRIAFLAFDDPKVDSDETLFVVFSPALRSYVGHVLPALGVNAVGIQTYREWASTLRRRHFPRLPGDVREDTPTVVQRLKLHPAMGVALAEHIRRNEGPQTPAQALDDWSSLLTHERLLFDVFDREGEDLGGSRRSAVTQLVEYARRRNEELHAWLGGDDDVQLELDAEDDTLLLRAWQLRIGPLRSRARRPVRYRHVAVDEVQDFSPLEVQVLIDCLDERRSITLAGDTQQHVVTHSGFTSWSDFLGKLGIPGTEIETLQISYRSSREIVEFGLSVLGDLREDEAPPITTKSGPPVEFFRFTDRGACVVFLADALNDLARSEPLASVAVLTPSRELTEIYYRGLVESEVPGVRQVRNQDFTFSPGIEVTEIEQVKGLEFDYVLLVDITDDAFPEGPPSRRLLHVAATRAIHQLWLTCVGTPSSILRGLAAERR